MLSVICGAGAATVALGGDGLGLRSPQSNMHGSGPAKGFIEVSADVKSVKALQNFRGKKPVDFVFDHKNNRFVMGNNVHGHDGIADVMKIPSSRRDAQIIGGQIEYRNGKLISTEWSGHYGNNWNPQTREQFQEFMKDMNVNITHEIWKGG